jgi:hypothetical protein
MRENAEKMRKKCGAQFSQGLAFGFGLPVHPNSSINTRWNLTNHTKKKLPSLSQNVEKNSPGTFGPPHKPGWWTTGGGITWVEVFQFIIHPFVWFPSNYLLGCQPCRSSKDNALLSG